MCLCLEFDCVCTVYVRYFSGLQDDAEWNARCALWRETTDEESLDCDRECDSLKLRLQEMGGMSRLRSVAGGDERINQRRREKEDLQKRLSAHVKTFHRSGRRYNFGTWLEKLKTLCEADNREFEFFNRDYEIEMMEGLQERLKNLDKTCRMFANSQHLQRRAEMLIINVDEGDEPVPDFIGVESTANYLRAVKPWDVQVQRVHELFLEDLEERKEDDWFDCNVAFEWELALVGREPWAMYLQHTQNYSCIGLLYHKYVSNESRSVWDLELFVALDRGSEEGAVVAVHELKPKQNHYSLKSVFGNDVFVLSTVFSTPDI